MICKLGRLKRDPAGLEINFPEGLWAWRWGFYERIKFRCEYKGVGGKWDFRIKVGTAETWGMSLTSFWPIQDTKQENINILENNLVFD